MKHVKTIKNAVNFAATKANQFGSYLGKKHPSCLNLLI